MWIKNILVNNKNETIGATLVKDDNTEVKLRTSDLIKLKDNIKLENAIIDNKGHVRAKKGNLNKERMYVNDNKEYVSKKIRAQKDIATYTIMLKNTEVCNINRNKGTVEMINKNLLPFDIHLDYSDYANTIDNTIAFNWWCANRLLSLDKEYEKAILNACNIRQVMTDKDRADMSLQCRCLSLKDSYWVKKQGEQVTWNEVNLFENNLSNAVVDIALKDKHLTITNKHLMTSELATAGKLPKAWYRKNNTFYLYKGDKDNSVDKEVNASKILNMLGFKVLQYEKSYYDNCKVSVSKCFTNPNISYITAGDMMEHHELDTNYYEYDMMNLCDYLVGNSDRHPDNWGYIFNDKRQIIGFAPIFDFNRAFETSESSMSLTEYFNNNYITMLELARRIVKKYNIILNKLSETENKVLDSKYIHFVNHQIDLLYNKNS